MALSILPFAVSAFILERMLAMSPGQVIIESMQWAPSLGFELSFRIDGLSLLFALIITTIGGVILIYGGGYLRGHKYIGRFYAYILLFMASMLGVVLSENLLGMFVFWEMTGVSSWLLIGYYHEKEESRKSALQALLVTGMGGLALLAGVILLGIAGGSYNISA